MQTKLDRVFGIYLILIGIISAIMVGLGSLCAQAHIYGTIWDESFSNGNPTDQARLAEEYQVGIRLKNVYIRWSEYEPTQGQYSAAYIAQKQEEIKQLRMAGFTILLRINPFPFPDWVFATNPDVHLKNQYGFEWDPEKNTPERQASHSVDSSRSAVSVWDPDYRAAFKTYLTHVFQDFGTNFWGVYLTVGQWGEVTFPSDKDYYGHSNCYWGWDPHARADISAKYPAAAGYVPGQIGIAGERVLNGGFEDTHYTDSIANWESTRDDYYLGGWAPSVQTGGASEGNRYLRYQSPSEHAGVQYRLRQCVVVNTGTAYAVSGALRTVSVNTTAWLILSQPDAQGQWHEYVSLSTSAASWTTLSTSYTSLTFTTRAYIDVFLTTLDGSSVGTVEADALSVTDGRVIDRTPARLFFQWYYESLTDFVRWQIATLKEMYDGRLILMGGGWAARSGDIEAEVNADLTGTSRNHYWVCRAHVPERYLAGLTDTQNVYFAETGVESDWRGDEWSSTGHNIPAWEESVLESDWSQPHYFAHQAERFGLGKFCENGGYNNSLQMVRAFQQMDTFNYEGIGWYTAGQLFQSGLASLSDYADQVSLHGGPEEPEGWVQHFTSPIGVTPPPGWRNDDNGRITALGGTQARVEVLGTKYYGGVLSPILRDMNSSIYSSLEIKVNAVTPGAFLDIGLQEERGAYRYYPIFAKLDLPGTYQVNLPVVAAGADLGLFSLKVWINGNTGTGSADLDYIKLIKPGNALPKANTQPVTYLLKTGWEAGETEGLNNLVLSRANVAGLGGVGDPVFRREVTSYAGVTYAAGVAAYQGVFYKYMAGQAVDPLQAVYCNFSWMDHTQVGMPLAVTLHARVAYWIYPRGDARICLNLHCTDGTDLRNAQMRDQNQGLMQAWARQDKLNAWNYVEVDLSAWSGKTIDRVEFGYEAGANTGAAPFQAFIDDVRIFYGADPGVEPGGSGWEQGQTDGYINSVYASQNTGGYFSYLKPECGPRDSGEAGVAAYRGQRYLMVAGAAQSLPAYCYYWLFSDSVRPFYNITIQAGMTLAYRIYHLQNKHVSVDFHCTDGTELRNTGLTDQNGVTVHPAARTEALNQWHQVVVDLSSLAGKVVDRVMIGFDELGSTGQFRAYIDDVEFSLAPLASYQTLTPTMTPTVTSTATLTSTSTISPTVTVTPSITPTLTQSATVVNTHTPTITVTATLTPTVTVTPTVTQTATPAWEVGDGRVQAYPNPSRGKVTFACAAADGTRIQIDVYHLTGERVAHLDKLPADTGSGTKLVVWEALGVAPGIYFCRVRVQDALGRETLQAKLKVALIK